MPSLSLLIAAGLVAGLALGLAASANGPGPLMSFATGVEPIGTIWISLIRMCVVPLVVTAVVSGVASIGDLRTLGRVGARTLGFILGTLVLGGVLGLGVALLLVPLAPVSPEAAAALRQAAAAGAAQVAEQAGKVQGMRQFLIDLVPPNAVKAAADGSLLPLTVFAVLIGAAVGSLEVTQRRAITSVTDAIVAALIRLIGWIMLIAPLGVLCLAAPMAAKFGLDALRSLAVFVLSVVVSCTLFALVVFPAIVRWLIRAPVLPFARAVVPGTMVAFTTTSSMAALPTMMDTALNRFGMSPAVASFVLPLAATLNRPGGAIYQMTAVVFVGSLYGAHLGVAQFLTAGATMLLMTFSIASIPSATVFTTAPVLLSVGLPVESVALLLGVDRIPDMFRTGLNTLFHQTAAAVVAHAEGEVLR